VRKLVWKTFQLGLAAIIHTLLLENITLASEPKNQNTQVKNWVLEDRIITNYDNAIAQVTSVSQLSDVQPTDWAFQALQSLVERYGCIAGYPDSTYRGNRALTRYEFAAGLNACLDRINELIATATTNQVTKEDLTTLQKLQEEFAAELASLQSRVDALEASAAQLEANQFSTTTQLVGELITYLNDAFGENADDVNNTNLGYRLRLDFNTSFTGEDRLRTRLQATNLRLLDTGATFGGSQGLDPVTGEPIGFGLTGETRFTPSSVSQNGEVDVTQIQYRFPVGDRLTMYLDFGTTDPTYVTDTISPFVDTATGALSNFGQVNPVYFPIGNQGGVSANFLITPSLSLDFGYLGQDGDANDPGEDAGIFNGGYSALVQLVYNSDRLKFALLYLNFYSTQFGADTLAGSNPAKVNVVNDLNNPDNNNSSPVVGNSYGFQINYRVFDGFELGGWVGYTVARAVGEIKGDADVWNYAVTLNFPDLFTEGDAGGIVFGMQPRLTGTSNSTLAQAIGLPAGERKDRDTGLHVEAFYRFQLNDNISITPGFFWLTAPNHDDRNPDTVVGVIRTTFVF
jgi:hypothetical protein